MNQQRNDSIVDFGLKRKDPYDVESTAERVVDTGLSSALTRPNLVDLEDYPTTSTFASEPWYGQRYPQYTQAIRDMLSCCMGYGLIPGEYIGRGSFGRVVKLQGVQSTMDLEGSDVNVLYEAKNPQIVLKEGTCWYWGSEGINEFIDKACLSFFAGAVAMKLLQAVRNEPDFNDSIKKDFPATPANYIAPHLFDAWEVSLLNVPQAVTAPDMTPDGQVGMYGQAMENKGKSFGSVLASLISVKELNADDYDAILGTVMRIGFDILYLAQFGFVHQDLSLNNALISPFDRKKPSEYFYVVMVDGAKNARYLQFNSLLGSTFLIDFDRINAIESMGGYEWTHAVPTSKKSAPYELEVLKPKPYPKSSKGPVGFSNDNPYEVWFGKNAKPEEFPYEPVASFLGFTVFIAFFTFQNLFSNDEVAKTPELFTFINRLIEIQEKALTWKTRGEFMSGLSKLCLKYGLMTERTNAGLALTLFENEADFVSRSRILQSVSIKSPELASLLYNPKYTR